MKKAIEDIIKLWSKITGKDIEETKHRIRLGVDYEYSLHQALNLLDEDATGILSAFKIRQAFKEFINCNSLTIADLFNGEWDEIKDNMLKLKSSIYSGIIGDTYDTFVKALLKNINNFGKELTEEQFNNIEKIEDVLTKAITKFNNKYEIKQERFTEGELKKTDAKILKRLFRFNSFEEFVDNLKATTENNFICVVLCDRTYKQGDGSEYDEKYDSHFAIGVKNNGVVITVSDRIVLDSPSGSYKGRNPGREFWNKVDYSYLPYHKIEDLETATENSQQLKLTYEADDIKEQTVAELFDDVGIIYITTLLLLTNKKYFIDLDGHTELKFFGKDIKLLPPSNSRELTIVNGKLELPTVPKDSNYTTYQQDPNDKYGIYNNGLYDWLLDMYPLQEDRTEMLSTFIGTKEEAQRNIWWQVRNAQKEHIKKCLDEDFNRYELEKWFKEQFDKNAESIIEYMIKTPEYDNLDKYCLHDENKEGENKSIVWKCYRDGIDMDLSSLKEVGEQYNYDYKTKRYKFDTNNHYPYPVLNSSLGKVKVMYYGGYCPALWFENDNDQRYYELKLTLRTWGELKKFFNIEELPKQLKRWLYMRKDYMSLYGWEPYSGNSILNFTDPMNSIKIPANEICFYVSLNISKTMYNKIKKLQK